MSGLSLRDFVAGIVTLILAVAAFMGGNLLLRRHCQAGPKHRYCRSLISF